MGKEELKRRIIEEGRKFDLMSGEGHDETINPSCHIVNKEDGKTVAGPYFGKDGFKKAKDEFDSLENQTES